jgi:hypothetical protein
MKKARLCFWLVLIGSFLLIFDSTGSAGTYYVKNSGCSDSNSGSESSPWCHCPGLANWTGSAILNAGDTVYFDRGGIWTASSGNCVLNVAGGVSYIGDSWGSGTRAKFQATNRLNHAVIRFYRDHANYETVVKGFEVDANHTATHGIGMNHPSWDIGYSLLTGAIKRIQNCVIHDTYSQVALGQYNYGIIISSWGGDGSTTVENVEILNNIIYNQSRTAINLYPNYNNNVDRIGRITIRGNETYSTAQDPGYSAGFGLVIKGYVYDVIAELNHFYGNNGSTGGAVLVNNDFPGGSGPTNIVIRYNILASNTAQNVYISEYGSKQIDFYGNIVMNAGGGVGLKVENNTSDSLNLKMYNNIFFKNSVNILSNYASNRIEFKNNIIYDTGRTLLSDPSGYISTNHNNNIYYRTDGGTLVNSAGSSYTPTNLASYESTGLWSNPLLLNTDDLPTGFIGTYGIDKRPNADGLSLQSNSPAKDSGASLGSPYNNSINSVSRPYGAGWDRGAYEVGVYDTFSPSAPLNLRIMN